MSSRIGLAIIGAGRMGRNHARLIAAGAPELSIVAIGDIDGAAARRLADEIGGATAFADPLAAISAPGVDAVLVAVASDQSSVRRRGSGGGQPGHPVREAPGARPGRHGRDPGGRRTSGGPTPGRPDAPTRPGPRPSPGQDRRWRPRTTFALQQPAVRRRSATAGHPRSAERGRDHARHGHPRVRLGAVPDGLRGRRSPGDRLGPGIPGGGGLRRRRYRRGEPPVRLRCHRQRRAEPARRIRRRRPHRGPRHRRERVHRRPADRLRIGIRRSGRRPLGPDAAAVPRFAAAYTDQARAFARSIQNDEPVSPSGADGRAAFVIATAAARAMHERGPVAVEPAGLTRATTPAPRPRASIRLSRSQTRRISSPERMVPPTTTRAFSPRIRWARPVGELIQRSASLPNRALNFAQPVWGGSLTSMTASADRQPAPGRQPIEAQVEVDVDLVAGQGPARPIGLDRLEDADADQRQLGIRVRRPVRGRAAAASEPAVPDQADIRVEHRLGQDLALVHRRDVGR